jgi:hypothetical protein
MYCVRHKAGMGVLCFIVKNFTFQLSHIKFLKEDYYV